MNRFGAILAILLLSTSAFAQQSGPRDLSGQSDTPEQPQAQLQRSVTQLYIFNLKNEVGLTDDQFIKAGPVIQQFIRMRFQNANQRRTLDQRQEQLLRRPDASEADIQKLNEEVTRVDGEIGTWEGRMLRRMQAELADGNLQLSARQISELISFNRKFFYEKLPTLVDQMRAESAPGNAQKRPGARANQKNQSTMPTNTLRGNNTPPPVQPRKKLAR